MADDTTAHMFSGETNADALASFAARASEGPVVMLNLLKFNADGGLERYMKYAEAVAPLLANAGAKIDYSGAAEELVIGAEDWDMVALVEYPTRQAFLDMVTSEAYQAISHLRETALVRSVLYATTPLTTGESS